MPSKTNCLRVAAEVAELEPCLMHDDKKTSGREKLLESTHPENASGSFANSPPILLSSCPSSVLLSANKFVRAASEPWQATCRLMQTKREAVHARPYSTRARGTAVPCRTPSSKMMLLAPPGLGKYCRISTAIDLKASSKPHSPANWDRRWMPPRSQNDNRCRADAFSAQQT